MSVLALALATTAAATQPSQVAARTGVTGYWSVSQPICTVSTSGRQMYVPVPKIWAANRTAGSGNDLQYVRYWTRLVDLNNRPLTAYAFGGQGTANDNVSARLPYTSTFSGYQWNQRWNLPTWSWAKLQVSFAWYDTSWRLLGTDEPVMTYYAKAGSFGTIIIVGDRYC
jgi:hypothetical protein